MSFITDRIALEGLTFDDVLLIPSYSDVLPKEVSLKTRFTRNIMLNLPFVSAAMDTVTEAKMAISIAREGGIGVIHKNMSIAEQAKQVASVKRAENGMINSPVIITADKTVGDALRIMAEYKIGGIPVVDEKNKLIGIVIVLIRSECCKRAYIRGAFLAAGSLSDPQKAYHLEFVCNTRGQAQQLVGVIAAFGIEAHFVERKKASGRLAYVVYVKEGDGISDLLNMMKAHVALMSFEDARIRKDIANSINRQVNCETANIKKTITASSSQVEDILYLQERVGLENLPEGLRDLARLRLENRDTSLKELGEMLDPPVGKSGVNHRLRKIKQLADTLRETSK